MRLPALNINMQRAEIGINVSLGGMNISSPRSNITINNQPTQLHIDHQPASFSVDWRRIRSESGLRTTGELANDFRDEGRQAALRGIAEYVRAGNHLANHRIPARAKVSSLASSRANARLARPEVNIGLMPRSPANLTWDTGGVNVNWVPHSINIDANRTFLAEVDLAPRASAQTYVRTQPHFSTSVVDLLA